MTDIAERIAQAFHESAERLALGYGYEMRSAWAQVPEANRALMVAVVSDLLARGWIAVGEQRPSAAPNAPRMRRGKCPECGRTIALRNDGTLRQHQAKLARQHGRYVQYAPPCNGMGELPVLRIDC
jgi:hypothetical protein